MVSDVVSFALPCTSDIAFIMFLVFLLSWLLCTIYCFLDIFEVSVMQKLSYSGVLLVVVLQ